MAKANQKAVGVMKSAAERRGEKPGKQPPVSVMKSAAESRGDEPGWTLKEPCDGCGDDEVQESGGKES